MTAQLSKVVERLLNSYIKAKSSPRRKLYRERLETIIKNLCVASTDLLEQKVKYKELEKRYSTNLLELKAKYKESEKELNNLFGSLMQRAFKGELNLSN